MEEDEATPSSLPPWVELEYTVSVSFHEYYPVYTAPLLTAHEDAGRHICPCAVYASLTQILRLFAGKIGLFDWAGGIFTSLHPIHLGTAKKS